MTYQELEDDIRFKLLQISKETDEIVSNQPRREDLLKQAEALRTDNKFTTRTAAEIIRHAATE